MAITSSPAIPFRPSLARASVPCSVTLLRLAATPLVALLLGEGRTAAGLLLALTLGATDLVDGTLARRLRATTRLGAWMDSIADRALYMALFGGIAISGEISTALVVVLATVLGLQSLVALRFVLGAKRGEPRPKTLMGAVVAGFLALCLLPVGPEVHRAFELATAMAAADGLWWYARQSGRSRDVGRRLVGIASALESTSSGAVRSLAAKVRGVDVESRRTFPVANAISIGRVVPGVIGVGALAAEAFPVAVVAGLVFVALDVLDGMVARALDQCTRLGTWIDPCIDKTAFAAVVLVATGKGWLGPWLVGGITLRFLVIAVIALLLMRKKIRRPRNFGSGFANGSALAALALPSSGATDIAVILNVHNVLQYGYHAGQAWLRRKGDRRGES